MWKPEIIQFATKCCDKHLVVFAFIFFQTKIKKKRENLMETLKHKLHRLNAQMEGVLI